MNEMVEQGEGDCPVLTLFISVSSRASLPPTERARARGALSPSLGYAPGAAPSGPPAAPRLPTMAHQSLGQAIEGGGRPAGGGGGAGRGGSLGHACQLCGCIGAGPAVHAAPSPPPAPGLPPPTRPHHPPPLGVGQCNCSPSRARAGGRTGPKPPIAAEEKGACGGGTRARERQRERALAAAPPSISEARRPRPRPARADAPATHL